MRYKIKTPSVNRYAVQRLQVALVSCLAVVALLSLSSTANAETNISGLLSLSSVTDSELDRLRGGFRTPEGLDISFGITKLTRITDQLYHDSSFKFKESAYTADKSGAPYRQTADTDALNSMTPTVPKEALSQLSAIQNSLDNQLIQSVSIIDIRITNLVTLRSRLSTSRWIAERVRDF